MDLEAELISALEELGKERKKNKLLNKELGKIKESTQEITIPGEMKKAFMDLKSKIIEESLREQLKEKEGIQEEFEKEIVSLRRNLEK